MSSADYVIKTEYSLLSPANLLIPGRLPLSHATSTRPSTRPRPHFEPGHEHQADVKAEDPRRLCAAAVRPMLGPGPGAGLPEGLGDGLFSRAARPWPQGTSLQGGLAGLRAPGPGRRAQRGGPWTHDGVLNFQQVCSRYAGRGSSLGGRRVLAPRLVRRLPEGSTPGHVDWDGLTCPYIPDWYPSPT